VCVCIYLIYLRLILITLLTDLNLPMRSSVLLMSVNWIFIRELQ